MSSSKNLDNVINSRFLRWLLFLQNYDLEVKFRPSKRTACADVLSRLPLQEETGVEVESLSSFSIDVLAEADEPIVSRAEIANEMKGDEAVSQVMKYVVEGWPKNIKPPSHLVRFYTVRESLDVEDGCLYFADRIYVPPKLRELILKKLHVQHSGVVKTKQLARNYFWWPDMNQDIENYVKQCGTCQKCAKNVKQHPLMSWQKSSFPFERIHLDHFFFDNKKFLIIVDDFSNWIHVDFNQVMNTECVIMSLRKFSSIFGLPSKIVTDNGTPFTSDLFEKFCNVNGIKHLLSPPYHPQSNGLAERAVGIVKENLKKFLVERKANSLTLEAQIQNFLFMQHQTPSNDGRSPAEKLFNFKTKNQFSQFQKSNPRGECKCTKKKASSSRPKIEVSRDLSNHNVEVGRYHNQRVGSSSNKCNVPMHEKSNNEENKRVVVKMLKENEPVYVYWPKATTKYIEGIVLKQLSPLTYNVKLINSGNVVKIHRDSLKPRVGKSVLFKTVYRSGEGGAGGGNRQTQQVSRSSTVPQPGTSRGNEGQAAPQEPPRPPPLPSSPTSWTLRRKPRVNYKSFL